MRILAAAAAVLLFWQGAAFAATIDLQARGLTLGDLLFTDAVTVEYDAARDFFQAASADFVSVVDGNPLATNTIADIAPDGVTVAFSGFAIEQASMAGLLEFLIEPDIANGAFASLGRLALVRIEGAGLDLGGDVSSLPASLSVFAVVPLPLTAPLLLSAFALLAVRSRRRAA